MAEILRFPDKPDANPAAYLDECEDMVASAEMKRRIEGACRALTGALCRGVVQPDKFFIMYEEDSKLAYMCFDYGPGELMKSVSAVLEHEGKSKKP